MRTTLLLFSLCATLALAADPQIGDSRDDVIKKAGKPTGRLALGSREILDYAHGQVELTDGVVSSLKWLTNEELARKQSRDRRAAQAAAEAQRHKIYLGETERDRLLADPGLKTNTPAARVAAWKDFTANYPEVPPPQDYKTAEEEVSKEEATTSETVSAAPAKPKPKLSSSKRRRYQRAGDTNMVDIVKRPDDEP